MRRIAAPIAIAVLAAAAAMPARADSCQEMIPQSLAYALARNFPGYRTPLVSDNAPEDIHRNQDQGGSSCLGADTGDFIGDGRKDYVIGLTARAGGGGLAVIAQPRKGGWSLRRIRSGIEAKRFLQVVRTVPPGHYERPRELTTPLEAGESRSVDCRHAGVLAGAVDATSFVHCYVDGNWLQVRVSP